MPSGPGARFSKVPKLFGWHNSLCIFKTKVFRDMKLCSYFNLYSLYNIWNEKISFTEWAGRSFTNDFSGPKSSRDFRETDPWGLTTIQRELCHPKYARKVSGLSRNRPQEPISQKSRNFSGLCHNSFISSQRRGSKPSNFAIPLVFLRLKSC